MKRTHRLTRGRGGSKHRASEESTEGGCQTIMDARAQSSRRGVSKPHAGQQLPTKSTHFCPFPQKSSGRQDDSTRAVRSCCKNVGCSTISRILRFAYGLARRGVSNHRDHWSAGKRGVATGCERSEGRKGGVKASCERSERRRGWSVRVPQNYQIW